MGEQLKSKKKRGIRMFALLSFILWILSVIMMIIDFHWGWLIAFIITTFYFIIRFGINGGDFDFDFDIGD
jgi:hypothetical protein